MKRLFPTPALLLPLTLSLAACGGDSTTTPRAEYATIDLYAGVPGFAALGGEDLPPLETNLYLPQDLTWGPDGRPYIADWNNHRIRVVDGGRMQTLIGTGRLGDAEDAPALEISLNHPTGVSFDPLGRLILCAWHNSKICRMDFSTMFVETICGDGRRSFGGDGGPAGDAVLDLPASIVFDEDGNLFVMDQANQRIRRIGADGIIQTIAGTGKFGFSGDGGPATEAMIGQPVGQAAHPAGRMAFSPDGNLYFCDTSNSRIRMIDKDGIIHTVAGTGERGYSGDGGPATQAKLRLPIDVAFDSLGNLYIADTFNHCIRKVDRDGIITLVAGTPVENPLTTPEPPYGYSGDGGPPTQAKLFQPYGIAFDRDDNLYIADTQNHVIRVIRK